MTRADTTGPDTPVSSDQPGLPRVRPLGLIAMAGAVVCFSLSSTIAKKAQLPGPTLAFYRMLGTTAVWWTILWITEHRIVRWADIRRTLVPGIVFGANMTCFFTGVTKTSVANAEFIAALTPLVVVPAGAFFFKERINRKALWFGLISLAGLVLVLFNGPASGDASWGGNGLVFCAVVLWSGYLLSSRRLRDQMSVQGLMASIMTTTTLAITPFALVTGYADDVTVRSIPFIAMLAVLTGTVAHGLIVFAQRTVGLGTITILQVAQPALAVGWAYLLLDQILRPIQLLGMALVLAGLFAVVVVTRRTAGHAAETLDPVGPAAIVD